MDQPGLTARGEPVTVRNAPAIVKAASRSAEFAWEELRNWTLAKKKDSDVPYQEPESTRSSRQRVHAAQACENTLRTGSAIPDNPGIREVIPSTSVGWAFVTKESPSP